MADQERALTHKEYIDNALRRFYKSPKMHYAVFTMIVINFFINWLKAPISLPIVTGEPFSFKSESLLQFMCKSKYVLKASTTASQRDPSVVQQYAN